MGLVTIEALIENAGDLWEEKNGTLSSEFVRRIAVEDALVDPRSTILALPTRLILQLGLLRVATKPLIATTGQWEAGLYSPVRLTIMDRSCTMDVLEVPNTMPVLIGRIPLHHLDFVIDMREQKLIGNPRHNGEHVYEMF